MASVSLEDLKEMLEVSNTQLSRLVSNDHLKRLAPKMTDWQQYSKYLGLEEWLLSDIKSTTALSCELQAIEVLKLWKKSLLERATYDTLARCLLSAGNAKLGGEVCKLAKEHSSDPGPPSTVHTPLSPSDEIALLSHTDPTLLDREVDSDPRLLLQLADLIPDWQELATALGLSDVDRLALQTNTQLSLKMKTVEMIKRWQAVSGFGGTYRKLVEACLLLSDEDMAKEVCRLLARNMEKIGETTSPQELLPVDPDTVTADEVAENVGLEPIKLDQVLPDDYQFTLRVTKFIPDWYELATALGLSPVEREWLQTNKQLSYRLKTVEVIKIWTKAKGLDATYRALIEAFLILNKIDLAKQVCTILLS